MSEGFVNQHSFLPSSPPGVTYFIYALYKNKGLLGWLEVSNIFSRLAHMLPLMDTAKMEKGLGNSPLSSLASLGSLPPIAGLWFSYIAPNDLREREREKEH